MAEAPNSAELIEFAKRSGLINLNVSLEDALDDAATAPMRRAVDSGEEAHLTLCGFTRFILVTD